MLLRIIKKDLKRKKTMNVILLLFIILATTFVAGGINNVTAVMNGTDYYMDKANVGDYFVVAISDDGQLTMEEVLAGEPAVQEYRIENIIFGAGGNILLGGGKETEAENAILFQSVEDSAMSFFDADDKEITALRQGHAYVSGSFMKKNGLEPGDTVEIRHGDVKITVMLDGKAKDAFLGSEFIGNTRFLLSGEDMRKLLEDENVRRHFRGQIGYIETDDVRAVLAVTPDIPNVMFEGSRSALKVCYLMDMIVAFIVLLLSVCLMIVAFVVLKFTITFTIAEEFREIGVMKAIGIANLKIRGLYIAKYLLLAVVGAVIGFFASIPFGRLLLKPATENMVLGNDMELLANISGAAAVIFFILLFAYLSTGKVKKLTPIDAVRAGQTGERYRKKTIYRIGKSHVGAGLYMGVNDVVSSPGRFATIIASFLICALFVLMLVNTTATMKSPNLVNTFGAESDLYITSTDDMMRFLNGSSKSEMEEYLRRRAEEFTDAGMPSRLTAEILYKYMLSFDGNDYSVTCCQGIGVKSSDYTYIEGYAPQAGDEIALTPQISEMTGAGIGDTVIIDFGGEKIPCIVTAYFQSMNQLGQVIRFHEDAPADFTHIASVTAFQIYFTDDPSAEEIEDRKERIREMTGSGEILNATEYCIKMIGVVDTMEAVQYLLLGITLVVVLLVTILMERSFIADETSQIAILKAIGFQDRTVILWHTCRFGLVAVIAAILAAALSIPMTNLCISPIFGIMGAAKVKFNIEPLQVFVVYPGVIVLTTILTAALTALYTKTIKSSDTANIE